MPGANGGDKVARSERLSYNKRMIKEAKLIKVGNSVGVILPREVLAQLHARLGDPVWFVDQPGGVALRSHDPGFVEAMTAAEDIMREDRDILAVLAK